jgi:serine/threonine-protein kinase
MTDVSAAGVHPGDVLAGKYRVDRVLGVGGMGVVVAAHHLQLDEMVALKFLCREAAMDPAASTRFAREARMAVKIKNEHVARVSDVGELEGGAPYMVMEYLEGEDLSSWIRQRGRLSIEQATDFVLQACVAVADAHALGIVHRDLKPANLFCVMRSDGQLTIKVLDFGISKISEAPGAAPSASVTKTSSVMGTPLYMAPEQMRSAKTVDARSDIWSLGVILFELVSGRVPFEGDSVMELVLKVANDPPPALRTLVPSAPEALEKAILRCLEKEPEKRFPHVGELAAALLPFGTDRARGSVDRVSGIIAAAGLSTSGRLPEVALAVASAPTLPIVDAVSTQPVLAQSTAGMSLPAKPSRSYFPIVGVIVLGVVAVVALLTRGGAPTADAPKPAVSAQAAVASPAPTPAPAPAPSSPLASTATPPPTSPSSSAPPPPLSAEPTKAPPSSTPRSAKSPSPPPPAAPATPAAKSNCNPNFTYDAEGNKIFKPECFGH